MLTAAARRRAVRAAGPNEREPTRPERAERSTSGSGRGMVAFLGNLDFISVRSLRTASSRLSSAARGKQQPSGNRLACEQKSDTGRIDFR